ncbi:MAG TPA: TlpA family protein disulfide reductase [Terracidiphilus sp.]|nr:TlpA family protein disulfide reductase [Terracidiphilus sp.]
MKRNTIVLGIVLFLLAVFAWAGWANWQYRKQAAEQRLAAVEKADLVPASGAGDVPHFVSPLISKPAPNFVLEDVSGKKVSLESYKGKAVLINFWATWCGPCKIETPWLVELRNQYADKGFEILGVSADDLDLDDKKKLADEKREIAKFAQQEHMQYPVLINGGSLDKPYGGLDALPTSYYVDRSGKVVAATLGLTSKAEIEADIHKALGE